MRNGVHKKQNFGDSIVKNCFKKIFCILALVLMPCAGFAAKSMISLNKAPADIIVKFPMVS